MNEIQDTTIQYADTMCDRATTLPKNILLKLYRMMILTRELDNKAHTLHRKGLIGTYPASTGQEAVFVSTATAMGPNDIYCPYYRDQGAMLVRGVSMVSIIQYWGGDERGNLFAQNSPDLPICIPLASQCSHAVGAAWGLQYHGLPHAVVCTIGDGATSKGDFYEAINFSSVHRLPIIFVINNNQWAISTPLSKQTASKNIIDKLQGMQLHTKKIDGNDAIVVYNSVYKALKIACQGGGPSVIEAACYRLCDHTTVDDASKYVPKTALREAQQHDPLNKLRNTLLQTHHWSKADDDRLLKDCSDTVTQAVNEYKDILQQIIADSTSGGETC